MRRLGSPALAAALAALAAFAPPAAALAAAAVPARAAAAQEPEDAPAEAGELLVRLRARVAERLAASPTDRAHELEELARLGDDLQALEARRTLVRLVALVGTADDVALVPGLLGDPDREVRGHLVDFATRADLGAERGAERIGLLERVAADDPEAELRARALEGLGRLPLAEAARSLQRLLFVLPAAEQAHAAEALGETARGRARVVALLQGLYRADGRARLARLADEAHASLLASYGRGLAELPGGGSTRADRLPLVLAQRSPAAPVRAGSAVGLDNLVSRLGFLGEEDRRFEVLEALAGEGFDDDLIDYRIAWLQLTRGRDPRRAVAPAVRLARRADGETSLDARRWLFYGRYLEGAAELAAHEPAAAVEHFDEAARIVDGLIAERVDLRPRPDAPSKALGALDADYSELRALVELMRLAAYLAQGREPGSTDVLELARLTHLRALEAQLRAARSGYRTGPRGFDLLLDHELGPRQLVFGNASNPDWDRDRALGILIDLGHALASVAPQEMPGFVPAEGIAPDLADPLKDERRRALYQAIVIENVERMREDIDDELQKDRPNRILVQNLSYRVAELFDALSEGGDAERKAFLDQRARSTEALELAQVLRTEGRPEDARELSERMLAALETGEGDWSKVSIELSIGSSMTDEGRPEEAEQVMLRALERLEAMENTLVERLALVGDDAQLAQLVRGDIAVTRTRKADALISLAVNANVGLREPDKALGYFERAFELQQGDFNRVLLACYRARSGRLEEARAQLDEVVVSPPLYYNLACTYALMGEKELAFDYLQREFEENLMTEGELRRQRDWALRDPDLASLHDDPRFAKIVGAPEGE